MAARTRHSAIDNSFYQPADTFFELLRDREALGRIFTDLCERLSDDLKRKRYFGRNIAVLAERFPEVPRIALTATADAMTRKEIAERLSLTDAPCFVSSFDRPNIRYEIVDKQNALNQLKGFIAERHPGEAGIVYCLSRAKVEDVATSLREAGLAALPYHAGLDAQTANKLSADFISALSEPAVREKIQSLGLTPVGSSQQEFQKLLAAEVRNNGEIVRRAGGMNLRG